MSDRFAAIIGLVITYIAGLISNDGTAFVLMLFLGGAFIVPSKQEWQAIIRFIHNIKARVKRHSFKFKPAIF